MSRNRRRQLRFSKLPIMLADADDIEPQGMRESDVCVAGAGAAGITLARELARQGCSVCLLEGGGLELEEASQELYAGVAEPPLSDEYLVGSRLRYLGGTTNHWLGYCRPFDAWDFETRPWLPNTGWPIARRDLGEYYERAAAVLELPRQIPEDRPLVQDGETSLVVGSFHRNPQRFRTRYLRELRDEQRVELLLHASAVHVALSPSGRAVDHIEIATPGGRRFPLRARRFVLALGAIENARLMLVSNDVQAAGVGNRRDLVGRYFMDHPVFSRVARFATRATSGPFHSRKAGSAYEACLLDRAGQEAQGTGGCALGVDLLPSESAPGFELGGLHTPSLRRHVAETGASPGRWAGATPHLRIKAFDARPEPVPDPESRVLLDSQLDLHGKPRVRLRLRQGAFEGRTVARALDLLATAVGRHGLGRLWIEPEVERWKVTQGFHHAGTTRMHDDPTRGVVDRNCRVHDVGNLFVAGGSVFPTAGSVNPTFTIVALALRLAGFLAEHA